MTRTCRRPPRRAPVIEGMGRRSQRPPDRRYRGVLRREFPLDGQLWLRHQDGAAGVPEQLGSARFPGGVFGQGLHRRGAALHGRMGSRLRTAGGDPFGHVSMGVSPTGKRVEIRYMDFWKVVDGKIVDNWVMVDYPPCAGGNWVSMSSTGRAGNRHDRDARQAPRSDHKGNRPVERYPQPEPRPALAPLRAAMTDFPTRAPSRTALDALIDGRCAHPHAPSLRHAEKGPGRSTRPATRRCCGRLPDLERPRLDRDGRPGDDHGGGDWVGCRRSLHGHPFVRPWTRTSRPHGPSLAHMATKPRVLTSFRGGASQRGPTLLGHPGGH